MQFRITECGQTWLQNFNDSQNDVFPWDGEMRTQRTLAPMARGNKPQVELQIVVARLTVARPCLDATVSQRVSGSPVGPR